MGPARRVKPDEENLMPPPTTIEELWTRMNANMAHLESGLRKEMREEGDPTFGNFVRFLKDAYARCKRSD